MCGFIVDCPFEPFLLRANLRRTLDAYLLRAAKSRVPPSTLVAKQRGVCGDRRGKDHPMQTQYLQPTISSAYRVEFPSRPFNRLG